jgi:hypothetical protein
VLHVSFSPWFPWFNIVSSCSIRVASTDWISSFYEQIIFHCVYMPVFKIHLLTNDSIYGILSIVLQSTWEFIYPSPKLISFPYIQASRQFSWSHGSSIASGFFLILHPVLLNTHTNLHAYSLNKILSFILIFAKCVMLCLSDNNHSYEG